MIRNSYFNIKKINITLNYKEESANIVVNITAYDRLLDFVRQPLILSGTDSPHSVD